MLQRMKVFLVAGIVFMSNIFVISCEANIDYRDDEMDEDYLQKVSLERGKSLAGTWEGVCFRGLDWFAFKVRS